MYLSNKKLYVSEKSGILRTTVIILGAYACEAIFGVSILALKEHAGNLHTTMNKLKPCLQLQFSKRFSWRCSSYT